MSILRIVYAAAMVLAVVFAFVPMSYSALLLAILGAVASLAVLPRASRPRHRLGIGTDSAGRHV